MIRTTLVLLLALLACGCFELQFSGSSICDGFVPGESDPAEWPEICSQLMPEGFPEG